MGTHGATPRSIFSEHRSEPLPTSPPREMFNSTYSCDHIHSSGLRDRSDAVESAPWWWNVPAQECHCTCSIIHVALQVCVLINSHNPKDWIHYLKLGAIHAACLQWSLVVFVRSSHLSFIGLIGCTLVKRLILRLSSLRQLSGRHMATYIDPGVITDIVITSNFSYSKLFKRITVLMAQVLSERLNAHMGNVFRVTHLLMVCRECIHSLVYRTYAQVPWSSWCLQH